jgi:transcription antitermination factor NusG
MRLHSIEHPWFAVNVWTKSEGLVSTALHTRGVETFLPFYTVRKRYSDRVKTVNQPFFPGYVFCRFDACRRLPILSTPGVLSIVSFEGVPAPIDESEISAIRLAVAVAATKPWTYLAVGERVRVRSGAMAGLEGVLMAVKNQYRLILSITMLQRSIAVELNHADVEPIQNPFGKIIDHERTNIANQELTE